MMVLRILALVLISVRTSLAQVPEPFFCGSQPCLIDTPFSCETFETEYDFQGSCCSLQPIPSIRGCRIEVWAGGNCFWTPICGVCDPRAECNKIYSTTSTEGCKASDFNPFNATKATCPPTASPVNAPEPTMAPISSASSVGMMLSALGVVSAAVNNLF